MPKVASNSKSEDATERRGAKSYDENDLARARDRVERAKRMHEKGYVTKQQLAREIEHYESLITRVESDINRAQDRVDWAKRMLDKGDVSQHTYDAEVLDHYSALKAHWKQKPLDLEELKTYEDLKARSSAQSPQRNAPPQQGQNQPQQNQEQQDRQPEHNRSQNLRQPRSPHENQSPRMNFRQQNQNQDQPEQSQQRQNQPRQKQEEQEKKHSQQRQNQPQQKQEQPDQQQSQQRQNQPQQQNQVQQGQQQKRSEKSRPGSERQNGSPTGQPGQAFDQAWGANGSHGFRLTLAAPGAWSCLISDSIAKTASDVASTWRVVCAT
jgi:hypothetical protein